MRKKHSKTISEIDWSETVPIRKRDSNTKNLPKQNTPPAK